VTKVQGSNAVKLFLIAAGLLVALVVQVALMGQPGKSDSHKIDAWVMAQQLVKDRLKAPSSADFGGIFSDYQEPETVVADLGSGRFRVVAWVDAQNSFGARTRNHFVCDLQFTGKDNWRCTRLVFDE
jgi:hypothetical protein